MKNIIKNIVLLFLISAIYSCEKPAPTELVGDESTDLEVEVVPMEPGTYDYSNGYDSTGVTLAKQEYSSVVTVSSVKTTNNNLTTKSTLARALFFDKTLPIQTPGGKIISFKTRKMGNVYFENRLAREVDLSIKLLNRGAAKDTVIGKYHLLHKRNNLGDSFDFNFNSFIDFKLKLLGSTFTHFQIPTPQEITGVVETTDNSLDENNLIKLSWNGTGTGSIDIIIGGINKVSGASSVSPYFKLTASDDGSLSLPAYLLKNFPFNELDKIVFTFIRKKETDINQDNTLKDNFIAAYSIHNIQLDIP